MLVNVIAWTQIYWLLSHRGAPPPPPDSGTSIIWMNIAKIIHTNAFLTKIFCEESVALFLSAVSKSAFCRLLNQSQQRWVYLINQSVP